MKLIFNNTKNTHTQHIIAKMSEGKTDLDNNFVIINNFNFELSFCVKNQQITQVLHTPNSQINIKDISGIWFYGYPEGKKYNFDSKISHLEDYCNKEFMNMANNMFFGNNIKCINSPTKSLQDQYKLHHLILANSLGFSIPDCFITSDIKFLELDSDTEYALKPLCNKFFTKDGANKYFGLTKKLTGQKIYENFVDKIYYPTMIQGYVAKKYEIRVTIVGDKIFACKIDSQASKNQKTQIDWREYDIKNTPHTKIQLPLEVESQLLQLSKSLGYELSAVDMIFSAKEEYVFLEINKCPAWIWIEKLTGLEITREILEYLEF